MSAHSQDKRPETKPRAQRLAARRSQSRRWVAVFEGLESRTLLSYTFALTGNTATVTGNKSNDTLVIDQSGGLLEYSVNGSAFSTNWNASGGPPGTLAASSTSTVNLIEGNGVESITLGTAAGPESTLKAQFNVSGTPAAGSTLTIDDSAAKLTGATYQFDGLSFHGPGGNSVAISAQTAEDGGITIDGGSGSSTYNILTTGTDSPVNVVAGGGTSQINVGDAGNLVNISSALSISDPTGKATLTLDDSTDGGAGTSTLTASSFTGFSLAPINYTGATAPGGDGVVALEIKGALGNSDFPGTGATYQIDGTSAGTATTIQGNVNNDTFLVGTNSGLQALPGPLSIDGGGGTDSLSVADPGVTGNTYTLGPTTLTASGFGGLTYTGIASLSVDLRENSGTDVVDINGIAASQSATVQVSGAQDSVNLTGLGVPSTSTLNLFSGGGSTFTLDAGGADFQASSSDAPGRLTYGVNGAIPVSSIGFDPVDIINLPDQSLSTATANVQGTAGIPLNNVPVGTFTDSDPIGKAADFSATIDWGDGTPASVGQVQADSGVPGNGFQVVGSHTYLNGGNYTITVTVHDNGSSGTQTINSVSVTTSDKGGQSATIVDPPANISPGSPVIVIRPDLPLSGTPVTLAGGTVGTPLTNVVVGKFTDSDTFGVATDFTATINWGDGTPASSGVIQADSALSGNGFDVLGSHLYVTSGRFRITVTVLDHGSSGTTLNRGVLTTFEDTGGQTATINDPATTIAPATPVTVTRPDLPLTSSPVTVASGTVGTTINNVSVGTFTDSDTFGVASDFTATINWGDGTPASSGVIQADSSVPGNSFEVLGSHLYVTSGNFTITATVVDHGSSGTILINGVPTTFTDTGGQTTTITDPPTTIVPATPVTVNRTDLPLTSTPAMPAGGTVGTPLNNVTLGSFTDTDTFGVVGDFTATINWGDGSPTSTGVIQADTSLPGNSFDVLGSHLYVISGNFTITVTIKDNGSSGTVSINGVPTTFTDTGGQSTTITDPPTAIAPAQPVTITRADLPLTPTPVTLAGGTVGTPLTNVLVGSFTDTDPFGKAGDFTATINWGDGSPTSAGVIQADSNLPGNGFDVFGSHLYVVSGNYPITVTVTDHGSSGTESINGVPTTFTDTGGQSTTIVDPPTTIAPATPVTVTRSDLPLTPMPVTLPGGTVGTPLTNVVVGSFTDSDTFGKAGDFSATINWGDGTTTSTGVIQADSALAGNSFDVLGSHLYVKSGTFLIMVTVHDNGSSGTTVINGVPTTFTDTGGQSATILDPPTTIAPATPVTINRTDLALTPTPVTLANGTVGTPLNNVVVGTFTDTDPFGVATDFTATINWGDGTATTTGQIQPDSALAGNSFEVLGSHLYVVSGAFPITVTVQDNGSSGTQTINGVPTTFTDTGGQSTTISDPAITIVPATPVTTTRTDLPLTPTPVTLAGGTVGTPLTNTLVGTFTDSDPFGKAGDFTATINWGDGTPSSTGVVQADSALSGNGFEVLGTHLYVVSGNFAITVTVLDNGSSGTQNINGVPTTFIDTGGQSATITDPATTIAPAQPVTITRSDLALTPTPVTLPDGTVGTALSNIVVGTFTDSDPFGKAGDFTATINWGDGTPASTGVVQADSALSGNGFEILGSHLYVVSGNFAVSVTVQDHGSTGTQNINGVPTTITDTGGQSATIADPPVAIAPAQPVTITRADLPLSGTPVSIPSGTAGFALNNIVVGAFTDSDSFGKAGDFTATINWGDGTLPSTGQIQAQTSASGNSFQIQGSHTYAFAGVYTVTVNVVDNGSSGTQSIDGVPTTFTDKGGQTATIVDPGTVINPRGPIVVTTTADLVNGAPAKGSLRAAILEANALPGPDTIIFDIVPQTAVEDIKLNATLPAVTDSVVIDATTQPGYQGRPIVALDGSATQGDGLTFNVGNSTVKGLDVGGFSGAGIHLAAGSGDLIQNSEIGTDASGLNAFPNGVGILIDGAFVSTIGGTSAGAGNAISGNRTAGIYINGLASSGTRIEGNNIGTNALGNSAIVQPGISNPVQALQNTGIVIVGAQANMIGGTSAAMRNLISGNYVGVTFVNTSPVNPNQLLGNWIGTDSSGMRPLSNIVGVYVNGASGNVIGAPGLANVISGNTSVGVEIVGSPSTANIVQGNLIGVAADGLTAFRASNGTFLQQTGVFVQDASGNAIGEPGAGNTISGNELAGVYVLSSSSTAAGNVIQSNILGAGQGGAPGPGNAGYGVLLFNASNNQVVQSGAAANAFYRNGVANIRVFTGPLSATRTVIHQVTKKHPAHRAAKKHPHG